MEEDWDLDGLDDLDDLDGEDLDNDKKKSSKKKKEKNSNGFSKIIPILAVIVVILIIIYFTTSNNSENSKENESDDSASETTTSEVQERVKLPLINTEQVAWTDEVCRLSSQDEWGSSLHSMPSYDKKKTPKTIRDDISDILERNAYRLGVRSVDLKELPMKVHSTMLEKQSETTVADANKRIEEDVIDPNIITMSQQLSSSFEDYSQSLYDMKSDLDSISDYDENGLRSTIKKVTNSFKEVNDSFNSDVNSAFNIKYFDNLSTLEKAAESENCSGSFANLDELSQEDKEKLTQQDKIREYAIFERCNSFINNSKNSNSMNDDLKFNIEMCNDVLSRTVVDKSDPLFKNGIDQQDSDRAMPKIESSLLTNTQQDQLEPTEGNTSEENTSSEESITSENSSGTE